MTVKPVDPDLFARGFRMMDNVGAGFAGQFDAMVSQFADTDSQFAAVARVGALARALKHERLREHIFDGHLNVAIVKAFAVVTLDENDDVDIDRLITASKAFGIAS